MNDFGSWSSVYTDEPPCVFKENPGTHRMFFWGISFDLYQSIRHISGNSSYHYEIRNTQGGSSDIDNSV